MVDHVLVKGLEGLVVNHCVVKIFILCRYAEGNLGCDELLQFTFIQ